MVAGAATVENDVLSIADRVDFSKYNGLHPLYTEYNVGHYRRTPSSPGDLGNARLRWELPRVPTDLAPSQRPARTRRASRAAMKPTLEYWLASQLSDLQVPCPLARDSTVRS